MVAQAGHQGQLQGSHGADEARCALSRPSSLCSCCSVVCPPHFLSCIAAPSLRTFAEIMDTFGFKTSPDPFCSAGSAAVMRRRVSFCFFCDRTLSAVALAGDFPHRAHLSGTGSCALFLVPDHGVRRPSGQGRCPPWTPPLIYVGRLSSVGVKSLFPQQALPYTARLDLLLILCAPPPRHSMWGRVPSAPRIPADVCRWKSGNPQIPVLWS